MNPTVTSLVVFHFSTKLFLITGITKLLQIGAEPDVVLFFDCPEQEMVKRVLNRNQVLMYYNFL